MFISGECFLLIPKLDQMKSHVRRMISNVFTFGSSFTADRLENGVLRRCSIRASLRSHSSLISIHHWASRLRILESTTICLKSNFKFFISSLSLGLSCMEVKIGILSQPYESSLRDCFYNRYRSGERCGLALRHCLYLLLENTFYAAQRS